MTSDKDLQRQRYAHQHRHISMGIDNSSSDRKRGREAVDDRGTREHPTVEYVNLLLRVSGKERTRAGRGITKRAVNKKEERMRKEEGRKAKEEGERGVGGGRAEQNSRGKERERETRIEEALQAIDVNPVSGNERKRQGQTSTHSHSHNSHIQSRVQSKSGRGNHSRVLIGSRTEIHKSHCHSQTRSLSHLSISRVHHSHRHTCP